MLPRTAEVVIIGGGVIGASIAYYLTRMGCRDVVVLERGSLASGSTTKAAGGIRQQFSTEVNVRLSQVSVGVYERFEQEFEQALDFHQDGYLFLLADAALLPQFQANVALQQRLGVDVRLLTPQEAGQLLPHLTLDDVLAATYCPRDGYADPYSATQGFAKRARQGGAHVAELTEARSIEMERGRVVGVGTSGGFIATERVVIAAGPWAAEAAALAGVHLPVEPYQQHIFVTGPFDGLPPHCPLTVDFSSGLYFRPEGEGALVGMSNKDETPGFKTDVNWAFLEHIVEAAVHRLPSLRGASVQRAWSGFYEVTPDHHAILGAIPEVSGLYCAVGFSGHGFMHAPAVGMALAEILLHGRASTVDVSALSLARFHEGRLIDEQAVI
ncbi:MAG: FAD-binding oxidoreductase [Chloroflexi bacterium]|nr:FAD-binding oxidoreductase [Chloroflexota bacterium]